MYFSFSYILQLWLFYFIVLCWSSHCVPLSLSKDNFYYCCFEFLSRKLIISFIYLIYFIRFFFFSPRVLFCSVVWNIFLCFQTLFDVLCVYEIWQNSYLSHLWRCLLVWKHLCSVCVCPVALVDLKWAQDICFLWVVLVATTLLRGRAGVGGARTRARCKLELLPDLVVVASRLRGRVRTQRAGAGALRELDFSLEWW